MRDHPRGCIDGRGEEDPVGYPAVGGVAKRMEKVVESSVPHLGIVWLCEFTENNARVCSFGGEVRFRRG